MVCFLNFKKPINSNNFFFNLMKIGKVIATQLLDVTIRVQAVRGFAVAEMSSLLETFAISSQNSTMFEVLYAAAWIVGEFATELDNPKKTLEILLKPKSLPGHIQSVYVQNIIKIFTRLVKNLVDEKNIQEIVDVSCLILVFEINLIINFCSSVI